MTRSKRRREGRPRTCMAGLVAPEPYRRVVRGVVPNPLRQNRVHPPRWWGRAPVFRKPRKTAIFVVFLTARARRLKKIGAPAAPDFPPRNDDAEAGGCGSSLSGRPPTRSLRGSRLQWRCLDVHGAAEAFGQPGAEGRRNHWKAPRTNALAGGFRTENYLLHIASRRAKFAPIPAPLEKGVAVRRATPFPYRDLQLGGAP